MMPLVFHRPLVLVLLLLIIPAYLMWRDSMIHMGWRRQILSGLARLLTILCLILAIADAHWAQKNDSMAVIFALDLSESVSPQARDQALEWIDTQVKSATSRDRIGLVSFGGNAQVEHLPESTIDTKHLRTVVNRNFTDIAGAIRLANAILPDGYQKRVVVVSDGNENAGNARDEARLAQVNNVNIYTHLIRETVQEDALIDKVILPEVIRKDEPFDLRVVVQSQRSGSGKLRIIRDGEYFGTRKIRLVEGQNVYQIPDHLKDSGTHQYEVVLETIWDGLAANNRGCGLVQVEGEDRFLLVEAAPEKDVHLARALRDSEVFVKTIIPESFPSSLPELDSYSAVAISNVPALRLTDKQMSMLEHYVKDLGGGLLMLGGEDSFGLGGYYKTPVENALPVEMAIKRTKYMPSMAVILAIDKSGSMSSTSGNMSKIMMAREAAIMTAELLGPKDIIGVIGFDSAAKWVLRPMPAALMDDITKQIATLRAGGGTSIYPALDAAAEALSGIPAIIKHMILLTDGMSSPGDFQGLTRRMREAGMTLTTVGIGPDADEQFLTQLAEMGLGRYFHGKDPSAIPRIFTKETFTASKSALVEEPFVPVVSMPSQVLRGINWQAAPELLGYTLATPKARAEVLLDSHKNEAVLVKWLYGIGRSMAFTSDAREQWGKKWVSWPGYRKFWSQAVRWLFRDHAKEDFQISARVEGGGVHLVVDAISANGKFHNFLDLEARITTPDYKSLEVFLEQVGPGRYEGRFPIMREGIYLANIGEFRNDGFHAIGKTGIPVSFSPEYRSTSPDVFLMNEIAVLSSGSMLNDEDQVFALSRTGAQQLTSLWRRLAIAALILMLLEVAIRRLTLPWKMLAAIRNTSTGEVQGMEVLSRLKTKPRVEQDTAESDSLITQLKEKAETIQERELPTLATKPSQSPKDTQTEETKKGEASPEEASSIAKLLEAKKRATRKD